MRRFMDIIVENSFEDEMDSWAAPPGLEAPRPEDWEMFRKVREECRRNSGGGGMCHEVSEWIESVYGWERMAGSYCKDGHVCIAGHYWNVLPNGSILDCTADQTGEGHDMRLIPIADPDHSRYDEEWYADWHPGHEEYKRYIPTGGRKPEHFTGISDHAQQQVNDDERGQDWWATHPDQLRSYLEKQIEYAKGAFPDSSYEVYLRRRLDALNAR